jgi:hypothetical protein
VQVAVNPNRAGTGIHVKNLEAMGYGRPLVVSPTAARGMREVSGRAYLEAGSPRSFARAVSWLLEDRAGAGRMAGEAYRFAVAYDARVRAALRELF